MEQVGQAEALRRIFTELYREIRPQRLLVLGCTTGKDIGLINPSVTTRAVGVDVNAEYLAIARKELEHLGHVVELLHGDVMEIDLRDATFFDLVHAALILEYVDRPRLFERIRGWLGESGVCSVVSQEPSPHLPAVSVTSSKSLNVLEGRMYVVAAEQIAADARGAGLAVVAEQRYPLSSGKIFSVATLTRSSRR
jgi:SAM-dependent methyltransferase